MDDPKGLVEPGEARPKQRCANLQRNRDYPDRRSVPAGNRATGWGRLSRHSQLKATLIRLPFVRTVRARMAAAKRTHRVLSVSRRSQVSDVGRRPRHDASKPAATARRAGREIEGMMD
jgi:hypothetical protein